MGFTNSIETKLPREAQLPRHILIFEFNETSQFLSSIQTKACMKEEQFEECDYKEKWYAHNPYFSKTCEHLDVGKQLHIMCFDGFIHVNKVLAWLSLVENYFELMGVPENEQLQIATSKLTREVSTWWEELQIKGRMDGNSHQVMEDYESILEASIQI